MNTIPSVTADAAIAPRTGSGSPQTQAQQRADAAPSVVSDNAAAQADPGVMLKITPPVASRQGDVSVPQHALPGEVAQTLADLEAERAGEIKALVGTAGDADEAVATRFAQALAALPSDVQEAIRQASTPAIAKLLRLAAMTAPGIKEAPAWVRTGEQALAQSPQDAAQALLSAIKHAPPFELAAALKAVLSPRSADASSQTTTNPSGNGQTMGSRLGAGSPTGTGQAVVAQGQATQPSLASQSGSPLQQAASVLQAGSLQQQDGSALQSSALNQQQLEGLMQQTPNLQGQASKDGATQAGALATGSQNPQAGFTSGVPAGQAQGLLGAPQAYPGAAQQNPGASIMQSGNPQAALSDFLSSLGLQAPAGAQPSLQLNPTNAQAPLLIASPHAEEGMRDALRLLMDGRLMWQGQFTEGVPMRFERSDAWRANRKATGGMEKGSSIRISLDLPSLGRVEVSGLGFGGQVSLRVQAQDGATSTMVQALPKLQAKLRERGLAGTQVVIEPL